MHENQTEKEHILDNRNKIPILCLMTHITVPSHIIQVFVGQLTSPCPIVGPPARQPRHETIISDATASHPRHLDADHADWRTPRHRGRSGGDTVIGFVDRSEF